MVREVSSWVCRLIEGDPSAFLDSKSLLGDKRLVEYLSLIDRETLSYMFAKNKTLNTFKVKPVSQYILMRLLQNIHAM